MADKKPSQRPQHNFDSEAQFDAVQELIDQYSIPEEHRKLLKPFVFKFVSSKNKNDHDRTLQARVHPNLERITKRNIANLPKEFNITMSDAIRCGLMLYNILIGDFEKDTGKKKIMLEGLAQLAEMEYVLGQKSLDVTLKQMKKDVIEGDFTLEESMEHLANIKEIKTRLATQSARSVKTKD